MPTSTVENYLKAIYMLADDPRDARSPRSSQRKDPEVALGHIAQRLSVTPGTVTTMMRHLAAEKLVQYEPRRGVRLTAKGRTAALRVLRRHRLVETFLVNVMKLDWGQVHEEAEALEHVISDRLLQRMDQMLGSPVRDPHGDPIPTSTGQLPEQLALPLSKCDPGDYVLIRVADDDVPFLDWLNASGFHPGQAIAVTDRDDFAQTITVICGRHQTPPRVIGAAAAHRLLVEPA